MDWRLLRCGAGGGWTELAGRKELLTEVQYVNSKKGKQLILFGGYTFTFKYHSPVKNTDYWQCTKHTCKAKLVVISNGTIKPVDLTHDHPAPREILNKNIQFGTVDQVKYINSKKGKKLIMYKDYTYNYVHYSVKMDTKQWICPRRKRGCRAKLVVNCHDKLVSEIKMVMSQSGTSLLRYNKYHYCHLRVSKAKIHHWRCTSHSSKNCRARIATKENKEIVSVLGEHSHPPPYFFRVDGTYYKV
ncbi:hypothetical protein B5X24_HaOG203952 [Helicoverpa armigera]|uniref:FLYWCH-type domain-containing protein n=1 Tax=Helicoverpa armigera TaxID=29058 RepID=A0A2W1BRQ8_HELAM|nr:hypothetical protein B5X24_HaOG203952 [Helicoverpa armigera]